MTSASGRDAARSPHPGRWVLLDVGFDLLALGDALYPGTSPKKSLDPTARRILLPSMHAASIDGEPRLTIVEDRGRHWTVVARPVRAPVSGKLLAVQGCYGPANTELPPPPMIGAWEWRVTPPGDDQEMRIFWSPEMFEVYGMSQPIGDGPFWWETAQWVDEVVAEPDRTHVSRILEQYPTSSSDALRIHTFAARGRGPTQGRRLRLAGRRDTTTSGPDTWLRGITMGIDHVSPSAEDAQGIPDYLDAAFVLARDPLCAIDTIYEHVYLTSDRFQELGIAMPCHRHLPAMCHPDDLPALRSMLKQATESTTRPAGPVVVRFAAMRGDWTRLQVTGSGVRLADETPHHVLCRVTAAVGDPIDVKRADETLADGRLPAPCGPVSADVVSSGASPTG